MFKIQLKKSPAIYGTIPGYASGGDFKTVQYKCSG